MKRLLPVSLALMLFAGTHAFSQPAKWQFIKVFPDTVVTTAFGVSGLAVAPDGNIWVAPAWAVDSIRDSGGEWWPVAQVFVYRPNGTPIPFSGFKYITVGSVQDSLFNGASGMRRDAAGNIVYATYDAYYKIDSKTGKGLAKVVPRADDAVATPAFTSANEMLVPFILPGKPLLLFDDKFALLGALVNAGLGFTRSCEVSKDGYDVYWAGYTLNKVLIYHSDIGTIGSYTVKDSMAAGLQVESFAWNPRNGYLYMSGGNIDTVDYGPFLPGHAPMQWIGFDVATKTGKDTITWNWNAYPYPRTASDAPRPRAIDFSVSGDTAYVACFLCDKAAVQMFRRVVTGLPQANQTIPGKFSLSQNYPNPFNPSTTIRYSLPVAAHVALTVFNALGQKVAVLVDGSIKPGDHEVQFNAGTLASGVYLCRIQAGTFIDSRKICLLK